MTTRDQVQSHMSTPKISERPTTALVAGAAGFLGSHLVDRLLSMGMTVIGCDNLQTGSLRNLVQLEGSNCFRFIEMDIVSEFDFEVDVIFNLACPASPVQYQADPIRTLKTSFVGTLNLLELARRQSAKLVQASTSEVYGDPLQHPQNEEYWGHVNPVGVRSCYDEGKRAAETLCFDFHRMHGVETRIARIFNTYGPRMQVDDGRVVSNFIVQALKGMPITIYGTGEQTRSFCYVDDLVDGLVALGLCDAPAASPINLGNPDEITLLELAEVVQKLVGVQSELLFLPLPQDDPRKRLPDIFRANKVLDWHPKVQLHDGLAATISYFRSLLI